MTTHIQFSIEDIDLIEEINENSNSQFATARIQAFSSDANRHDLYCSEDTLKQTASSIYDKPILYSIDDGLDDFFTHVEASKSLICGFVVADSAEFVRLPDSRLALSVTAKIWKRYAPKVMELFSRDKGTKKVSVEMELFETAPIDGILTKMVSFAYTGICILGTYVMEASPGANIQVLSFADEAKKYTEVLKEEFYNAPKALTFDIPEGVKENVKKALRDNKRKGGGNSVTLSIAKLLNNNTAISVEEIRHIQTHISDTKSFSKDNLNFMLCGGIECFDWSTKIISELNSDSSSPLVEENTDKMEMNMSKEIKDAVVENTIAPAVDAVEMAVDEKKESPADEKAETPAEEKKEEAEGTEKKFEFPADFDFQKMSALFADDEEEFAVKAKEEFAKSEAVNPQVVLSVMYSKMCKMSEAMTKMADDNKAYMAENENLKKFKADFEASQKLFEVEKTMKEMSDKVVLSDEARAEMMAEAEKFSFAEIDTWKTNCKAKSFDFALRETGKSDVVRIGMPFSNAVLSNKEDLWSNAK